MIDDLAWGDDGTLYIKAQRIHGVAERLLLAVTSSGTREVSEFPARIAAAFQQDSPRNNQFIVTQERPCHGCAHHLTVRRTDNSDSYEIPDVNRTFVLDGDRSLVLYPNAGIVIFDLKTRQSQEIALPVEAAGLLDQVHDGKGHLVAYTTFGPCAVDASSEEAESQKMLPRHAWGPQETTTRSVCFVKLP